MSAATKAKRSLAAHKANWTRKGRPLTCYSAAELEAEMICRAIARTDKAIVTMTAAIDRMWLKQLERKAALVDLQRHAKKGGAS